MRIPDHERVAGANEQGEPVDLGEITQGRGQHDAAGVVVWEELRQAEDAPSDFVAFVVETGGKARLDLLLQARVEVSVITGEAGRAFVRGEHDLADVGAKSDDIDRKRVV